jgi:hypothetical protein
MAEISNLESLYLEEKSCRESCQAQIEDMGGELDALRDFKEKTMQLEEGTEQQACRAQIEMVGLSIITPAKERARRADGPIQRHPGDNHQARSRHLDVQKVLAEVRGKVR